MSQDKKEKFVNKFFELTNLLEGKTVKGVELFDLQHLISTIKVKEVKITNEEAFVPALVTFKNGSSEVHIYGRQIKRVWKELEDVYVQNNSGVEFRIKIK